MTDMKPHEILEQAAVTFKEKEAEYGLNYLKFGPMMDAIFPDGVTVKGADEWQRFGVFIQMASKFTRIAENFQKGGHPDSSRDMAVYAAMLESLETSMPKPKGSNL